MTNKTALVAVGILVVGVLTFYLMSSPKSTTLNASPTTTESVATLVAPSLSFSPTTLKLGKDVESTVNVTLDQDSHTAVGATIIIKYDPTKVAVSQVVNGTLFPTVLSQAKISNGMAEMSVATPPESKGQTKAGTVLSFQVRGLSSASSTITFSEDTTIAALDLAGNILKSKGSLKIN